VGEETFADIVVNYTAVGLDLGDIDSDNLLPFVDIVIDWFEVLIDWIVVEAAVENIADFELADVIGYSCDECWVVRIYKISKNL
jgi:hypothetical protein